MRLSPLDPHHAEILDRLEAGSFLPASIDDFARLREIGEKAGLLGEDL